MSLDKPSGRDKKIIDGVMSRKRSYYASDAFHFFRQQGDAVVNAVDQRYLPGEQTTRSGFYLATHTALYGAMEDSFNQIYGNATPMFLIDSKKFGGEDLARRGQNFLNMTWDHMGVDKTGGLNQWLRITRDVPLYSMGVAYVRWNRINGITQKPVKTPGAMVETLEWKDSYDIKLNQPEIERHHPYNWFGYWKGGAPWEGLMRRWSLQDVQGLFDPKNPEPEYNQDALHKLAKELGKGRSTSDTDFHQAQSLINKNDDANERFKDVIEYWGPLNFITNDDNLVNDSREYHVVCDEQRIYRLRVNNIFGYRPIKKVKATGLNDLPYGRSLLAPTLPHTKIDNLMLNEGIDDVITRMHNGWAVWDEYLQNPDEFINPEGTNPVVYMESGAPVEKLPRRIGGESSGVLKDSFQVREAVNRDRQRISQSDTGLGAEGQRKETATASRIFAAADTKRTRSAITYMGKFGLIPIAKLINLQAIKNTPEVERRDMSYDGEVFSITNDDAVQIWNNNVLNIHDSILEPQEDQALKLTNFLQLAREVLLQDPAGLPKLQNIIRDAGRKGGIRNVEHYFPEPLPPQVSPSQGQPGSPNLSPPGQPAAASQGPEQVVQLTESMRGF